MDISIVSMILVFALGYFLIAFENFFKIHKTVVALMMGAVLWIVQFSRNGMEHSQNLMELSEHLSSVSEVILFLLGAIFIVEMIQVNGGFDCLLRFLHIRSKKALFWVVGVVSFFLSSILDNLTTTIVMVSLVQQLLEDPEDRLIFGGAVVIAANAGGAWTPIGDVTTTMLWIGGRISAGIVMHSLFLPSFLCLVASLLCLTPWVRGNILQKKRVDQKESWLALILGAGFLVFVPIFKYITGLPPYMGMVFSAALFWYISDIQFRFPGEKVISKMDLSGPFFFLGILLAVEALETAEILTTFAKKLSELVPIPTLIAVLIGLFSAIIDNIPLVAASIGMYDLTEFPKDSSFWHLIAYCAGTGGSALIIGSAAGVVFMGMEKVSFFAYLRRISFPAIVGYFVGVFVFLYLNL